MTERSKLIIRLANLAAAAYPLPAYTAREVISSTKGHWLASKFYGQDEDGEINCTWRQLARLERDVNKQATRYVGRA